MTDRLRAAGLILDRLTKGALYIAVAALAAMVVSQIYEIIARYFFNAPTSWVADSVGYLLLVSVFLSLPAVTKEKSHVAIDFLLERLAAPRKRAAVTALAVGGAVVCAAAGGAALIEAYKQFMWEVKTVAAFALPKWGLTAIVASGFFLSAGHFVVHAFTGDEPGEKGRI